MRIFWQKCAVACLIILTVLFLGQSENVWTEEEPEANVFLSAEEPIEQIDQRTPLTSAIGFMQFAENGDYDRAAEYLDLRYIPDEVGSAGGAVLAEQLTIYLQHVPGPRDSSISKVSNATVAQIPALYEEFGYNKLVETIRGISSEGSLFGTEYFKWIIALSSGVAGVVACIAAAS